MLHIDWLNNGTLYAPRYEEFFLPKGKKRPRSLRSLGLASLWCDYYSYCHSYTGTRYDTNTTILKVWYKHYHNTNTTILVRREYTYDVAVAVSRCSRGRILKTAVNLCVRWLITWLWIIMFETFGRRSRKLGCRPTRLQAWGIRLRVRFISKGAKGSLLFIISRRRGLTPLGLHSRCQEKTLGIILRARFKYSALQ